MKIVISDTPPYYLDLDAPTPSAEEVVIDHRTPTMLSMGRVL
jgi:hypothetical protein